MTRTSSILFWFGLIIIASLGLYRTSDRVQQLDRQLHDINAAIDAEKQSIHVLKAEWSYLASPARIEEASRKHLALRPTTPSQVASLQGLAEKLPTRTEAMGTVAVNTTPTANVRTTLAARVAPTVVVSHPAKAKPPVAIASAEPANNSGYVRNRMIMVQRTASAAPLPGDTIGSLINDLNAGH